MKILLLDDDYSIRQSLKIYLSNLDPTFEIYSSADGVEGLGLMYVLTPDIIIVDTTLPKYSGKEILDFIVSNPKFTDKKVIVMHDGTIKLPEVSPNFTLLDKRNRTSFLPDFEKAIGKTYNKASFVSRIRFFLLKHTFRWANKSDLLIYNIHKPETGFITKLLLLWPLWIFIQLITSIGLTGLFIFGGRGQDSNEVQATEDSRAYRVRVYPTLIGLITTVLFLLLQILLYIGGGIVIFNSVRLESIFADTSTNYTLDFSQAAYDNSLVEFSDGSLRLSQQFTTIDVEVGDPGFNPGTNSDPVLDEEPIEPEVEVETPTDTPDVQEEVVEPSEEIVPEQPSEEVQTDPVIEEEQSPETPEVLGATDVMVSGDEPQTVPAGFSTANPVVTFNVGVEFLNLVKIEEDSNINTPTESVPDLNSADSKRSQVTIEALKSRVFPQNTITYQLSPNNIDWYYFNANNAVSYTVLGVNSETLEYEETQLDDDVVTPEVEGWERTEQGFVSSNTIQEVNQYLQGYLRAVGGEKLYLRAYFHSDGQTQIQLNSLKVIREIPIISTLPEDPLEDLNPVTDPVDETEVSQELPTPVIYQATFVNGNKVVYGKVLSFIPDEELQNIKVRIYYTSSTDISKSAENKGEFIGETNLEKNESGDLSFLLITPNREGGYVTAELEYTVPELDPALDAGPNEDPRLNPGSNTVVSQLSKPLENSTFTVDSTGDEADHTLNGICSVGSATGGACTLRAGIAEANSVAGADNIYFNIPTSDAGYRDYDSPDSASSGDSTGGDDYWTIRPATVLPTISDSGVVIDGATQESNQGDRNTSGPDIEITRSSVFFFNGFTLSSSTTNTFNKLSISGFINSPYAAIRNEAVSQLVVTSSYIGLDVKGITAKPNYYGIYSNLGDNLSIGTSTSNGNIISGNTLTGIALVCGTGAKSVTVRGNLIGLNSLENSIGGTTGINIISGDCNLEVGGDLDSHRNIISGHTGTGISVNNASADQVLEVYNNFFGTDSTGILNRQNSAQDMIVGNAIATLGLQSYIGAEGKGNLFRFGSSLNGDGIRLTGERDLIISYNSFGDKGRGGIWSGNNLHSINNYGDVEIYNNFFGETESDPYFGLSFGPTNGANGAILNWGTSPIIKGNLIVGNGKFGIFNYLKGISSLARNLPAGSYMAQPVIGGQNAFTGSLCEGLEKNCIHNNGWAGISSFESVPFNESTLLADNDFEGNGPDGNFNIEQAWYGAFEIHSSNYRRTDLTGTIVTFPEGTKVRFSDDPSVLLTQGTAINATCLGTSGVSCPATGHSVGTLDNTHIVVPTASASTIITNVSAWFKITEYEIHGAGNRTDYDSFKFDQAHFSSPEFTFDGDSTNNVINTGTSRVIDTQTYTDRGEPWTDRPLATRNVATGDIGRFQMMEIEYVDANPIEQEDGSFTITVDSTEDQTGGAGSPVYSNDGVGAASGGMSKLATSVLANGKTSLREASAVAIARSGADKVHFAIPTSDPNWNTADFPNAFRLRLTTNSRLAVYGNDITIDASTQELLTGDNNVENLTDLPNATTGPEIIIDLSTYAGLDYPILLNGDNITLRGFGFHNNPANKRRAVEFRQEGDIGLNMLIENNDFINNLEGSIRNQNGTFAGIESFTLRGNVFRSTSTTGQFAGNFDAAEFFPLRDFVVEDNYFINNGGNGMSFEFTGTPVENISIRNNTFYGNGTALDYKAGLIMYAPPDGSDIEITGNVFDNQASRGAIVFDSGSGVRTYNNIFMGSPDYEIDLQQGGVFDTLDGNTPNDSGDSDTGANNLMNYPEIREVSYIGGGTYRISGILDNSVSGEAPFDIEICESDNHTSGHGGCIDSLGFFENEIEQIDGGLNPFTVDVTITGDDGTQNRIFTSLATNNLGSTSEFGENFITQDNEDYTIADHPITLVAPTITVDSPQPLFDWNSNGDADLLKYEVYLNSQKIGETDYNITQFQYSGENLLGEHTWQVIGKRVNGTTSGQSEVQAFTVQPINELTLVSPINEVIIDTKTPMLDWNADPSSNVNNYDIYLNGAYYTTVAGVSNTQYQVVEPLAEATHTWQVVAYYKGELADESQEIQESGRSTTETFTIKVPVVPVPISEEEINKPVSFPQTKPTDTDAVQYDNSSHVFLIVVALVGVIGISIASIVYFKKRS